MITVIVQIHVRPEFVEQFRQATIANVTHSRQESGIARFDFYQQNDDPNRFVLVEVYREEKGTEAHKQTNHYLTWREAVEPMMAEARIGKRFTAILPDN